MGFQLISQPIQAARVIPDAIIDVPGVFLLQPIIQGHVLHDEKGHQRCHLDFDRILAASGKLPLNGDFYGINKGEITSADFPGPEYLEFADACGSCPFLDIRRPGDPPAR